MRLLENGDGTNESYNKLPLDGYIAMRMFAYESLLFSFFEHVNKVIEEIMQKILFSPNKICRCG